MRSDRAIQCACVLFMSAGLLAMTAGPVKAVDSYAVHKLVANVSGVADHTDPNLVNGWGLVFNPGGFWWVAANGTGTSTLYDNNGVVNSLVVTIPPPSGSTDTSAPTGIVLNTTTDFVVTDGTHSKAARFIFCTEEGTISGWQDTLSPLTKAVLVVDNSGDEAIYKGLALANSSSGNRLYAADFHNKRVDVFNATFQPVALAVGAFLDLTLPADYAPFNVAEIDGNLFVAYAKQDAAGEDEIAGLGNGFVNEYTPDGVFVRRFASNGNLNAPWAIIKATNNFGPLSGNILVGNFGDGRISAFGKNSGVSFGQLKDANNNPIEIDGLWGLAYGTGAAANDLYFAAGPSFENDGLFGKITVVKATGPPTPICGLGTPGTIYMTLLGLVCLRLVSSRKSVKSSHR